MRRTTVFPACCASESIEALIEGQFFFQAVDSAPRPPSPISRQSAGPATHRKTEKERQLADGRGGKGVGVEPNHTTARKPGPLKIFNPLCGVSSSICTM